MRKLKIILLHGPMCAGKGEQSKSLIRAYTKAGYKVASFDMGDRLREIKLDKTHPLSKIITPIMDAGKQVPLEIICQPWQEFFKNLLPDIDIIILSGVVRLIDEVEIFIDYITGKMEVSEISIFRLNVTNEKTLERVKKRALEQGRTDDQSDASIMKRIEVYYGDTTEAIESFKDFAKVKLIRKTAINFFEIDGNLSIPAVTYAILSKLTKKKSQITIHGQNGSSKSTIVKLACQVLHFSPESSGDYARKLSVASGVTIEQATAAATQNIATAPIANLDDQIDDYVKSFNLKNGFIMDTRMGFHFLPDSFKIYFKLAPEIAARWIWNNPERRERELQKEDINSLEDLANSLRTRAENDQKRYLGKYGVDIWDERNYDLVVEVKEFENKKHDLMVYVLEQFFKWLTSK